MDLSECENVGTLGTLNDSSLESSLLERKKKRVSSSTAFRKLFLFLLGIRAPALVLIFSALISMIASYVNSAAIAGAMLAIENHNPLALFLLLGGAAAFAFLAVFSPLAGWVVDSLCGRYRGVKCSLWLLSLPTLAASVVLLAIVGVPSDPQGTLDVNNAGYVVLISAAAIGATPLALGLLVFKSSVVQFGTDQLTDLTPLSCSLFVHGLLWTESVGRALPELYIGTLYPASLPINGWLQLFYALSFTLLLVVLLECCFHRCLAKEIKIPNPYRLLWIVFRSSLQSRERRGIESAKLDFGGTCSEVEVKRLQIVLAVTRMTSVFAAAGGLSICSSAALPLLARIMQDGGGVLSLPGCSNGTNCSYQSADAPVLWIWQFLHHIARALHSPSVPAVSKLNVTIPSCGQCVTSCHGSVILMQCHGSVILMQCHGSVILMQCHGSVILMQCHASVILMQCHASVILMQCHGSVIVMQCHGSVILMQCHASVILMQCHASVILMQCHGSVILMQWSMAQSSHAVSCVMAQSSSCSVMPQSSSCSVMAQSILMQCHASVILMQCHGSVILMQCHGSVISSAVSVSWLSILMQCHASVILMQCHGSVILMQCPASVILMQCHGSVIPCKCHASVILMHVMPQSSSCMSCLSHPHA
eukprot:Em0006g1423a